MKELVEVIAKALVDNPDEVVVTESEKEEEIVIELNGCRYICSGKHNITSWKQQCHRRYTAQLQFQPPDFIR
jgi:hypothetical protein